MQLINPSTSSNELNTTLTPHSITHGDACFAYFNKIWGIPSASAKQVTGIAVALEPFLFDTIYGHYFDRVIPTGGKHTLEMSVKRYVAAISGAYNHE